ncbi:hypothetical protein ETD86_51425 [Nonomuraea turkmeniaca]|uniref:Uncharacterized protein n=1 Tax=Nonomuraea turkmeniaca TaxID=103838 RepID=A0A5S4EVH5_9ACTN|nr:hypothetical protein [Nonomuraea turkmeniaca]TMR07589.1 hypothetical protein ETD86_51425 [Nonomuraea turkmeniaca]
MSAWAVPPGRTVDITADRRFKIAEKALAFLRLLVDLGYIGLHPDVIIGYRRRRGEKTLPEGRKAANRFPGRPALHRRTRQRPAQMLAGTDLRLPWTTRSTHHGRRLYRPCST